MVGSPTSTSIHPPSHLLKKDAQTAQREGLFLKERKNRQRMSDEAVAYGRRIRISPIKLNLVAELIRGKHVDQAVSDLSFCRKRIAPTVQKVLLSAIANAENNHELNIDRLWVREVLVGRDMMMKRFRPRAKGRAGAILKPFSNLRIVLVERETQNVNSSKG